MNQNNAVIRCLDYLRSLWGPYRENEHSRICRWLVTQDAYSLINAFYQVNADESSDAPEIFLRLASPFINAASYGPSLSKELASLVEGERQALLDDGIEIHWVSDHRDDPQNTALGFFRNFFHFALSLDLEEEEPVVAFIAPVSIEDPSGWKKWWTDVAALQLPPQIRLMICEVRENNFLQSVAEQHPAIFTTIEPEIDAPGIMRQLMDEYGDQDDDCTHFRKAFFALTREVGGCDAGKIRQAASEALSLARQTGLPHLEIAVLCAAGNGLCIAGEMEPGIDYFDQARRIARQARSQSLAKEMPELTAENLYDQLGVHAAFFKGGALVGAQRYAQACASYEEAAIDLRALTNGASANPALRFLLIEALRMSGLCREKAGEKTAAPPYYEEALQQGERLDPASRKNTTLAHCGQVLITLYRSSSQKNACLIAQEKMNALLGVGWEQSLPQRAA